jgi:hypothetical protein
MTTASPLPKVSSYAKGAGELNIKVAVNASLPAVGVQLCPARPAPARWSCPVAPPT